MVASALFWDLFDEYILWSLLVGLLTFGWLFHHSFWYVSSEEEEYENPDKIEVGVFPRHNDDMKLEVAWTILPFILIVYLTYISWAPLDAVWTSADGGLHGDECEEGQSSNNYLALVLLFLNVIMLLRSLENSGFGVLIAIQMMMHGEEMLFQIEGMSWVLISVMLEPLQ